MSKKFPNITYDLTQDIIGYNGIMSLKDHALNLCIGLSFKVTFIDQCELMESLLNEESLSSDFYNVWREFEENMHKKLLKDLRSMSCEYKYSPYQRESKIHFVGIQILDFMCKSPILEFVNLIDFVRTMIFTCQGTINLSKSVLRLNVLYQEPHNNFRMKCHFFIEKDIKEWYESLDNNEIKRARESIEMDYILEFWLLEIESPDLEENSDRYEKTFFTSLEANDEIAVEYLWTNKISKLDGRRNILEKALKLSVKNLIKINITMFLLFQVNENEFEEFFQSSSFKVIENIIKEVKFHCIFDKIFDVLKIYFNNDKVIKIFGLLTDSLCEIYPTGANLDLVVNFFSSLPESDKINIVNESITETRETKNHFGKILEKSINNIYKDKYYNILLSGFKNVTELKNFFLSESGFDSLIEPAKTGYLINFFTFLGNIFKENYLFAIKRNFFLYARERICEHFINNSNFGKMEEFVNYFFKYDENIQEFKGSIPFMINEKLIIETLFPVDGILDNETLRKADELLIWCFNDIDIVDFFKGCLSFTADFRCGIVYFDKILNCVLESRFWFLNRLFEWKGIEVEEKTTLLQKIMNNSEIHLKINNLDESDKRIFISNFTSFLKDQKVISSDEINSFKQLFKERTDL
ncbi:UNVERIFIED_CONTAM: hypothetical protein RMT77_011334 [Armadillidium vulgare]